MLRDAARRRCLVVLALLAVVLPGAPAWSVDVVVFDEDSYGGPIGGFYSGLYGGPPTTAAYVTEVTDASLAGSRLLWALPANDFTTEELDAMAAFLAGGGRIGFLGEWYGFATARDVSITGAVASLGGHMSIATYFADGSYPFYAYRADGRIADDPFTDGVSSFVYGAFSPLAVAEPAKPLVFGQDGVSVLLPTSRSAPASCS